MSALPPYLKSGDKIAIVSTARKISPSELQPAITILESWGLQVVLGNNVYSEYHQFAGSDEERASDLQQAINNPEIKAVICSRGGYGNLRIIDRIYFEQFIECPKWIIGYSDVTVLHQHVNQNFDIPSLHATMPINFLKSNEAVESLRKALFGEVLEYREQPNSMNRKGFAEACIVGGNLSLMYALMGSISDIDTDNKILFIEDLDEYLYHIDRMMMSLKRSGKLNSIKGLIVGGMTEMKDNTVPFGKSAEEIVMEHVQEFDYPVCFNFPAGHVDRNLALFFQKPCKMEVSEHSVVLSFVN